MVILSPENVAFLGLASGIFLRTYLPYVRKKKKLKRIGMALEFSRTYLKTALSSLAFSIIIAYGILPLFNIPDASSFMILITSLSFGYGLNAGTNESYKWLKEILLGWHEPSATKTRRK